MRPAVLAPRALALLLLLLLPAFYYRRQLSTQYRRLAMTEKDARKVDMGIHAECKTIMRLGGQGSGREGSWSLCMDQKLLDERMRKGSCVVYGFGLRTDWSFEGTLARLGCKVFAFDPSLVHAARYELSPNVVFFPYGIAASDHKMPSPSGSNRTWEMRSVKSIMSELGHEYVDVLKFDIEGHEWHILQSLIELGTRRVGQILTELHFGEYWYAQAAVDRELPSKVMRQLSGSNWKLWRRDTNEFGFARPDNFLTEPLSFGITDPVPKGTFSCCYDVAWLDASQMFLPAMTDKAEKYVETKYGAGMHRH